MVSGAAFASQRRTIWQPSLGSRSLSSNRIGLEHSAVLCFPRSDVRKGDDVTDESGEYDTAVPSVGAAFQVNWFHAERPVAGTTFQRQVAPQQGAADGGEDPTSR